MGKRKLLRRLASAPTQPVDEALTGPLQDIGEAVRRASRPRVAKSAACVMMPGHAFELCCLHRALVEFRESAEYSAGA
jgi:hypothetical protein